MITFQLLLSDLILDRDEIYLNLGYGGTVPDLQIRNMLESVIKDAYDICRPHVGYILTNGDLLDGNQIQINNVSLSI